MKRYTRTDLACERDGSRGRREYQKHGCRICELWQQRRGDRVHYSTVHVPPLASRPYSELSGARLAVAERLGAVADALAPDASTVLVACLGNARITPDSLGAHTARALEVTRHVRLLDDVTFAGMDCGALCLVQPGVLGDTGVDSAELVRAVAKEVGAGLVIAVDALVARSISHLGAAVQICDRGLRPGSGVGNRRAAIDEESVGCPVISVGIPTVTDSATLISDALSQAGICGIGDELGDYVTRAGGFLVTPCDVDALVEQGGALLAGAIGDAFGVPGA